MRRIICLALCLLLFVGCAPVTPPEVSVPAVSASPKGNPSAKPLEKADSRFAHAEVSLSDLEYVHYDADEFYEKADLLASGDSEAVEAYQWLEDKLSMVYTMGGLCGIYLSQNAFDSYFQQEYQYCQKTYSDMYDAFYLAASQAVAAHPLGDLAMYLGRDTVDSLAYYEEMSLLETWILARETELCTEYSALAAGSAGDMEQKAGEIYIELVKIRTALAKLYGYDDYWQYANEYLYYREFDQEDIVPLEAMVKLEVAPEYQELSDRFYAWPYYRQSSPTAEETIRLLDSATENLSPMLYTPWQYLTENRLYDFGSDQQRQDEGYTMELEWFDTAFVYDYIYDEPIDSVFITHEFGHFCDWYYNPTDDQTIWGSTLDVSEVFSTGMVWLVMLSGEGLSEAVCIDDALSTIVQACIIDEFERYVYSHPDLSYEMLNKAYYEISRDYGVKYGHRESSDSSWVQNDIIVTTPCYYVSYAVSQLTSMSLWQQGLDEGIAKAAETYEKMLTCQPYAGYLSDFVKAAGLSDFLDPDYSRSACTRMLNRYRELIFSHWTEEKNQS